MKIEDIAGKRNHDIYASPLADTITELDKDVAETGRPIEAELDYATRSGKQRSYLSTRFPLFGSDGSIIAIGAVHTDITEHKLAQEALAQREAQLRVALDNIPGGLLMLDGDLRIKIVNDQYCKMFDRTLDDLRAGRLFVEVIRENLEAGYRFSHEQGSVEEIAQRWVATISNGEAGETEFARPDGRILNVRYRPVEGGGVITIVTDVTERKRAEQELQESREIFQAFVDNLPQFVNMRDTDGRYLYVNKRFEEWTQNDRDDIVGKTLEDIYTPEQAADFGSVDRKVLDSGENFVHEREVHYPDGVTRTVLAVRFAVKSADGNIIGVGNINNDITEQKRAAEEITLAHALITDSIDYASNIQRSALPDEKELNEALGKHFVIWQPCHNVGGDIYWRRTWGAGDLIILADCTGHGVPGAFLTLIAGGALDQALTETRAGDCAALIQRMHHIVQRVLGQDRGEGYADDGLELGVCFLPKDGRELRFSGAHLSLYIQEINGAVRELKGDRNNIGYRRIPHDIQFTNHVIEIKEDMCVFMTTDGLTTQVGEKTRLPFTNRGFIELLESLHDVPVFSKGDAIMAALRRHMGARKQRDDISLIGFEIGPES